jgi:hypothetical protein
MDGGSSRESTLSNSPLRSSDEGLGVETRQRLTSWHLAQTRGVSAQSRCLRAVYSRCRESRAGRNHLRESRVKTHLLCHTRGSQRSPWTLPESDPRNDPTVGGNRSELACSRTAASVTRAEKQYAKSFARRGGHARAKALTKERRSEISRLAAEARWKKVLASTKKTA